MDASLTKLSRATGWACVAIGAGHVALGVQRSVPGAGHVSPTLESQEAFYNSVFIGYGLTWLHASREGRTDRAVEAGGVMALGGIARLVALKRAGAPHPFYLALTAVEFAVPAAVTVLARRSGTGR